MVPRALARSARRWRRRTLPEGWLPEWVAPAATTAAAIAAPLAVTALTSSLASCRLAAWRRPHARAAVDFPNLPKGSRIRPAGEAPCVKKGGHGGARPGSGSAKGTSPLVGQRGIDKKDEEEGYNHTS